MLLRQICFTSSSPFPTHPLTHKHPLSPLPPGMMLMSHGLYLQGGNEVEAAVRGRAGEAAVGRLSGVRHAEGTHRAAAATRRRFQGGRRDHGSHRERVHRGRQSREGQTTSDLIRHNFRRNQTYLPV